MYHQRLIFSLLLLATGLALSSALPQRTHSSARQKSQHPQRSREQSFAARGQATDKLLTRYLASEAMAAKFVDCFDGPCSDKAVLRLISDMKKLKDGGQCEKCDPKEQEIINQLLYKHVSYFQKQYRSQFTRLLPKIARLIL